MVLVLLSSGKNSFGLNRNLQKWLTVQSFGYAFFVWYFQPPLYPSIFDIKNVLGCNYPMKVNQKLKTAQISREAHCCHIFKKSLWPHTHTLFYLKPLRRFLQMVQHSKLITPQHATRQRCTPEITYLTFAKQYESFFLISNIIDYPFNSSYSFRPETAARKHRVALFEKIMKTLINIFRIKFFLS